MNALPTKSLRITSFRKPCAFLGKSYAFLSNFAACEVVLDGSVYPTVEHAYQAAKTLDPKLRREVMRLSTAAEAKRLGRELRSRVGWNSMRLSVMANLLWQKFTRPDYKELLIDTAPAELVEENTWGDTFWGVCNGSGHNHLGRLLMEIRVILIHTTEYRPPGVDPINAN